MRSLRHARSRVPGPYSACRPVKLEVLEQIVHPAVRESREGFVTAHPRCAGLVFEIPLLFETGGEKEFDKIVVVSAPAEIQRSRVLARTGMSAAKLEFDPGAADAGRGKARARRLRHRHRRGPIHN